MARTIYISEFDLKRLNSLIDDYLSTGKNKQQLLELRNELNRAEVVAPKDMPSDVITMNSTVRLRDLDDDEILDYTLVFPSNADISKNRISILAPIGTALIGFRKGDTIEWKVPGGTAHLIVEEIIYQPESAGHYHL
ncbi:MAG: nucleoside diphosphate kinase regulator [Chitinispirillaceae bacterium]